MAAKRTVRAAVTLLVVLSVITSVFVAPVTAGDGVSVDDDGVSVGTNDTSVSTNDTSISVEHDGSTTSAGTDDVATSDTDDPASTQPNTQQSVAADPVVHLASSALPMGSFPVSMCSPETHSVQACLFVAPSNTDPSRAFVSTGAAVTSPEGDASVATMAGSSTQPDHVSNGQKTTVKQGSSRHVLYTDVGHHPGTKQGGVIVAPSVDGHGSAAISFTCDGEVCTLSFDGTPVPSQSFPLNGSGGGAPTVPCSYPVDPSNPPVSPPSPPKQAPETPVSSVPNPPFGPCAFFNPNDPPFDPTDPPRDPAYSLTVQEASPTRYLVGGGATLDEGGEGPRVDVIMGGYTQPDRVGNGQKTTVNDGAKDYTLYTNANYWVGTKQGELVVAPTLAGKGAAASFACDGETCALQVDGTPVPAVTFPVGGGGGGGNPVQADYYLSPHETGPNRYLVGAGAAVSGEGKRLRADTIAGGSTRADRVGSGQKTTVELGGHRSVLFSGVNYYPGTKQGSAVLAPSMGGAGSAELSFVCDGEVCTLSLDGTPVPPVKIPVGGSDSAEDSTSPTTESPDGSSNVGDASASGTSGSAETDADSGSATTRSAVGTFGVTASTDDPGRTSVGVSPAFSPGVPDAATTTGTLIELV